MYLFKKMPSEIHLFLPLAHYKEETRNSFFGGKGGVLKPAAPFLYTMFFNHKKKGESELFARKRRQILL